MKNNIFYKSVGTLLFFLLFASITQAQNVSTDRVDIALSNAPIVKVFESIEHQTKLVFVYNSEVANLNTKVSLNEKGKTVTEVLKLLSAQTNLTFKQIGNNITVSLENSTGKGSKKVKGKVVDDKTKEALVGVIIKVQGTSMGTVTDIDGGFIIDAPLNASKIQVSYVGYISTEYSILGDSVVTVYLKEDVNKLNDFVIVGYGTQSKSLVTGSIASVDFEELSELPVPAFDQALTAKMPGVEVIQATGDPGANAMFRIRGLSSLSAGSQPLIVMDGIPLSYGANIANINPADIASVEVLKDAASTAIYGSRGTNGVVIITTKSGSKSTKGATYNFYAKYGIQDVPKRIELMDAYQFADSRATAIKNNWIRNNPGATVPSDPKDYGVPDYMIPYLQGQKGLTNTDWQDQIFRKAPLMDFGLSVSGKTDNTSYFLSGNYLQQDGVMISSDFKRYSFRSNIETKLTPKLTFGVNLNPTYGIKNKLPDENYNEDGIILSALCSYPFFAPYNSDGELNISQQTKEAIATGGAQVENPVAMALLIKDQTEEIRMLGSSFLSYRPIKGLELKTFLGTDILSTRENYFRPSILGTYTVAAPTQALGKFWSKRIYNWTNENTVSYNKSIKGHDFSILGGFTVQKENTERVYVEGTGYPNDKVQTINAATTTTAYTTETEWALLSYLARATYNYKGRYLLNASYRTDGSSRFGKNNKWGSFPSASVGWRPTAESFFPKNKVLTDMKVRASWGKTGNFFIDDYAAIARLGKESYVFNNTIQGGLAPITAPNDNLTWENTTMKNLGVDIQLFGGRVELVGDYYHSITKDLLLNVPVPYYTGYANSLQNIGKVQNVGYEIALNTNNTIGDLIITTGVSIYTNRNKVLALGPDQEVIRGSWLFSTEVGQPIGSFWGYKSLGVIESQEQIDNYPTVKGAEVGRTYLWQDTNGDGEITEDDKVLLGNYFPDYNLNFTMSLQYKGLSLSATVQSVQGHEVFNYLKLWTVNQTNWSPPLKETEDHSQYVYPDLERTDNNYQRGSMLVEDGSFVRLRNVTIGYDLPRKLLAKYNVRSLRVYISGQNIHTWTNYSGYNPEVSSRSSDPLSPGIDYGNYPVPRVYSAGINMTF